MAVLDWFRRRRSEYTPLPTDAPNTDDAPAHAPRQERARRGVRAAIVALSLVMLGYLAVAFLRSERKPCDTPERGFWCGTTMSHSWGQYSPYFSAPSDIDDAIPRDCEVTFAQVLSRHGARAPTRRRAVQYTDVIDRIRRGALSYSPAVAFLQTYNYSLGADQLTPMGQQQMVNSGLKFYRRYRALARESIPFVRAGGQDRVVHSAENFTQGFHAALLADPGSTARADLPYDMVIISEAPTANNTLHHGLCDAFETGPFSGIGARAQAAYRSEFAPPITARLNRDLPGANLSDADAVSLMDLCPFETVASPGGAELAPFCHLFTAAEWRAYDYYQSLGKWYGSGPGNPLGPTQGVGFVNELLARLTRRPVRDATSTNRTLVRDPATFPLDRPLYADFSHDNDMMGVLGALGVYAGVPHLDNRTRTEPEDAGGFAIAWAVPFAGRFYIEKMRCGGGGGGGGDDGEEMVRVLVNDRVMPLRGCGADSRGMCTLSRFVESMEFARGNGRWDWCFDDDTRESG